MRVLLHLAWKSLLNRRAGTGLAMLAIALAASMLLAAEQLREQTRTSFTQTISGVDLIVGARGSSMQLLLYAVFHLGEPTRNVEWSSVQAVADLPQVKWTIPISLGDSHRGFAVVGTSNDFFRHYQYGRDKKLAFASGRGLEQLFDVVLGAQVAAQFDYRLQEQIVLTHGLSLGSLAGAQHDDLPFAVSGILAPTGTAIDRAVFVSLQAIEAIHVGWLGGVPLPQLKMDAEKVKKFDLTPKNITAALVGLHNRAAVFQAQRSIEAWPEEALMAVLPGVTLQQLWQTMAMAEKVLFLILLITLLIALSGLVAVILATVRERRRELAILRAMGAHPWQIFALLALESLLITLAGCALGVLLMQLGAAAAGPWLESQYAIAVRPGLLSVTQWQLLGGIVLGSLLAGILPGIQAFRYALADGFNIKL